MEEVLFRIVSNANSSIFPNNTPNQFSNQMHPTILNARYIGITRISIFIDKEKIKDEEINSFFFVNTDTTQSTQIANQAVNSLNDFFIDLKNIKQSGRYTHEFLTDFFYVPTEVQEISTIQFTITNLVGDLHPVLSGSTNLTLKYTTMNLETNIVRLVSSANKQSYPENNAQMFTNDMLPVLLNVDSVALTKITIPLNENVTPRPPPPPPDYKIFTCLYTVLGMPAYMNDDADLGFIKYQYTDLNNKIIVDTVKFYIDTKQLIVGNKDNCNFHDQLSSAVDELDVMFEGWKIGSALDPNSLNIKLKLNSITRFYDVVLIPGSELLKKMKPQSLQFINWQNYVEPKAFMFNAETYIQPIGISTSSDPDKNNQVTLFNCLRIQWFNKNDLQSWIKKTEIKSSLDTYKSSDIFFIRLENVEAISYGQQMAPIIQVIPINNRYLLNDRLTIVIPFAETYFLRTLTDKITSFTISILDENLQPHTRVNKEGSTVLTLLINNGSNTEVRESSHFEQFIGQ